MRTFRSQTLMCLLFAASSCAAPAVPPTTPTAQPASTPASIAAREVSLTYLGVAGWELDDGAHTLLFDPYFTRATVDDPKAPLLPDLAAIARHAPSHADVILVGHSHYDHVLDVPTVAASTGAAIVGSDSTMHVARASGIAESKLTAVHGGERLAFGPFSVQAIRALHGVLGPPDVPIPATVTMPMTASQYGEGGTLQYLVGAEGHSILFVGTANFIESEVRGVRPDVAIVAVGPTDYGCRLMRAIGFPKRVYTNHFDAHWKPIGPEERAISNDARRALTRFADEVHRCSPDTTVVVPERGVRMTL